MGGAFAQAGIPLVGVAMKQKSTGADRFINEYRTLIGMHMHPVAVPLRISIDMIGKAHIICARYRPKYIGGSRAIYDEKLM